MTGMWRGKKVGVLLGGTTKEREVSLKTGRACQAALVRRGYDAVALDAGADLVRELRGSGVDVVFVALHGKFGEDGCVQGLLEWLRLPYTGSGVLASSVAMDKVLSKRVARSCGITVPEEIVFSATRDDAASFATKQAIAYPVIVKPSCEGSSINITLVHDAELLADALMLAARSDATVLVERYIRGREVTVGLLEGKALPVIEMIPKKGLYDYESKYTKGMTEYIVPARLSEVITRRLQRESETICATIGCSGTPRVDFIVAEDGTPHFLEVNTIPGMTELSLVPMAAKAVGIEFDELCERILNGAALKVNL